MTFKYQQSKKKSADSAPITMFASVYTPVNSSPHSPSSQSKGTCVDTGPTTCLSDSSKLYFLFVSFYFQLSPPVSKPLINRGVLLSTLLQDILHPSHHLLNVLLQITNKLGLSNKKKTSVQFISPQSDSLSCRWSLLEKFFFQILDVFLAFPVNIIYPVHLTLLNLIHLILDEEYKFWILHKISMSSCCILSIHITLHKK
jgi:hypothetical protein